LRTTENYLVHAHIAKIANIAHGKYSQHKVGRFLRSIDLNEHLHRNVQTANIRRKLVHIGNLYKRIITCLSDDNYSGELVLNGDIEGEDEWFNKHYNDENEVDNYEEQEE
jgi:hypothetical protein